MRYIPKLCRRIAGSSLAIALAFNPASFGQTEIFEGELVGKDYFGGRGTEKNDTY